MKYVKMLGLLAVAAAALMAFAGTASATTITSSGGETPSITATSTNSELDGAFVTVKCSHSEAKGEVTAHGAGVKASGPISSLTFTSCNYETTVEGAGTLSIDGTNNSVSSNEAKVSIKTSVGTCVFTTNNTAVGTLTESSETGGNAILDINSSKIPRTGGNFLCGSSGTWTGSYTVNSPTTLNVD